MLSESLELLGKNLYTDIPGVITLQTIPVSAELEYMGSEDFEVTMIDKIFPKAIQEKAEWRKLLEIDFYWICRCIRLFNYGPYYQTNAIICRECGNTSTGDYQVDLQTIPCIPLPDDFTNNIKISKDDFINFNHDLTIKLLTIQDKMNLDKDKSFSLPNGGHDTRLARICYMITEIDGKKANPVETRILLNKEMSTADYQILKDLIADLANYGLQVVGATVCPKCQSKHASYIALLDDRFFRPTLGNLKQWKADRKSERERKDVPGDAKTPVRKDS